MKRRLLLLGLRLVAQKAAPEVLDVHQEGVENITALLFGMPSIHLICVRTASNHTGIHAVILPWGRVLAKLQSRTFVSNSSVKPPTVVLILHSAHGSAHAIHLTFFVLQTLGNSSLAAGIYLNSYRVPNLRGERACTTLSVQTELSPASLQHFDTRTQRWGFPKALSVS